MSQILQIIRNTMESMGFPDATPTIWRIRLKVSRTGPTTG